MRSEKQKLAIIFQGLWMILSLPLSSLLTRALDCYDLLMLLFFYISISCPAWINNVWNWYKGSTNERLPKKIFLIFFAISLMASAGIIGETYDDAWLFLPIICFVILVLFNINYPSFFKKISTIFLKIHFEERINTKFKILLFTLGFLTMLVLVYFIEGKYGVFTIIGGSISYLLGLFFLFVSKKIVSYKKFILKLVLILTAIFGLLLFSQNKFGNNDPLSGLIWDELPDASDDNPWKGINFNDLPDAPPPDDLVPLDQYHEQK